MQTRLKKVTKYLYIVEIYKNGVWIDFSNKMPLSDALAAIRRVEKWH